MKKEKVSNFDFSPVAKNLGESSVLSHRPAVGVSQEITNFDIATIEEVRGANGEIVSQGREWARATFEDGGILSCRSILLSPDVTYKDGVTSTESKLKALASAKLTFLYVEERTSKRTGNKYKVSHFVPVQVG